MLFFLLKQKMGAALFRLHRFQTFCRRASDTPDLKQNRYACSVFRADSSMPRPACVSLRWRSFYGRGWITQAAHLKKPRRGFFAAGTDGGGRCCSNPPATIPLICFYKTETPVPGSDTGVLGGRGWIRTTEAEKQQIYSLSPLATREHAHILFAVIADCLYILSSEVAFVNYFFHGFSLFLSFSIFLRFTAIESLSITAKDPKTFSVLRSFWSW